MGSTTTVRITDAIGFSDKSLTAAMRRTDIDGDTTVYQDGDDWVLQISTKWMAEGELAEYVSRQNPEGRVTVHEEWDTSVADESGESIRVYVAGEHLEFLDRRSGLVPADLDKAINDVLLAIIAAPRSPLAEAAAWLVDGLKGTRRIPDRTERVKLTALAVTDQWGTDYSDLIFQRFGDLDEVTTNARRELLDVDGDPLGTGVDVSPIIDRWIESAREHGGSYTYQWSDDAGAYVIGGWDGTEAAIRTIHDDGEGRGWMPLESLTEGLDLTVAATWSDDPTD